VSRTQEPPDSPAPVVRARASIRGEQSRPTRRAGRSALVRAGLARAEGRIAEVRVEAGVSRSLRDLCGWIGQSMPHAEQKYDVPLAQMEQTCW
jgi:hypothetical protein